LSAFEIEHFFTLGERELAQVRDRRGALNRLALGLRVGFLRMTGTTLNSVDLIPPAILDHLGRQLGCAPSRRPSRPTIRSPRPSRHLMRSPRRPRRRCRSARRGRG
jgi:hypothetical protein